MHNAADLNALNSSWEDDFISQVNFKAQNDSETLYKEYINDVGETTLSYTNLTNLTLLPCFSTDVSASIKDNFVVQTQNDFVVRNDECTSIDENLDVHNNNEHSTNHNYALNSSSKYGFTTQNDSVALYNEYINDVGETTLSNTNLTNLTASPCFSTDVSASIKDYFLVQTQNDLDELFGSNKENHTDAQIRNNAGDQQIPHKHFGANAIDATVFTYDVNVIDNKKDLHKFMISYCINCGVCPWNSSYRTNRNCPTCETERILFCANCKKQYKTYVSLSYHLKFKCHPKRSH